MLDLVLVNEAVAGASVSTWEGIVSKEVHHVPLEITLQIRTKQTSIATQPQITTKASTPERNFSKANFPLLYAQIGNNPASGMIHIPCSFHFLQLT